MSEYETGEERFSRWQRRRLVMMLAVSCAVGAGCLWLAWLIGR